MRTRLLIELEIEGTSADEVYDVADHALDAGAVQELFEDPDRDGPALKVTGASVSTLENDLRHILWPGGDPESEHGSDTLAALANRLDYLRPTGPVVAPPTNFHGPPKLGLDQAGE